jgi:serine/threonine-protein kinase HipA
VRLAYDTLTTAETIPAKVLSVLGQGTSLGGAQPKAPVLYEGEEWIAKFKNKKAIIDSPTIEFATMKLAEKCGLDIPEIRHFWPVTFAKSAKAPARICRNYSRGWFLIP